jgi:hypothetical protein
VAITVRQRYKNYLTWDFNYTFSKSLDDASGLQTAGFFGGGGLVLNPFRQRDNRAVSNFDLRHVINANFVVQLPFGRGRAFFGNASRILDAFIGGWQLGGIARLSKPRTSVGWGGICWRSAMSWRSTTLSIRAPVWIGTPQPVSLKTSVATARRFRRFPTFRTSTTSSFRAFWRTSLPVLAASRPV